MSGGMQDQDQALWDIVGKGQLQQGCEGHKGIATRLFGIVVVPCYFLFLLSGLQDCLGFLALHSPLSSSLYPSTKSSPGIAEDCRGIVRIAIWIELFLTSLCIWCTALEWSQACRIQDLWITIGLQDCTRIGLDCTPFQFLLSFH